MLDELLPYSPEKYLVKRKVRKRDKQFEKIKDKRNNSRADAVSKQKHVDVGSTKINKLGKAYKSLAQENKQLSELDDMLNWLLLCYDADQKNIDSLQAEVNNLKQHRRKSDWE